MFPFTPCSVDGCEGFALTGSDRCGIHESDRDAYLTGIIPVLDKPGRIENLSLSHLRFKGNNFSGRIFQQCDFSFDEFEEVNFSECTFLLDRKSVV